MLQVSLLTAFFLAGLLLSQAVQSQASPAACCSSRTCRMGQHRATAMTAVLSGTSSSNIHHCGRSSQQEEKGQQCPRDMPQRVYLYVGECSGRWKLSTIPSMKAKRKSGTGEDQDTVLLTVPLGREDRSCHAGTLPLWWIGRRISPPSALGESPRAYRYALQLCPDGRLASVSEYREVE